MPRGGSRVGKHMQGLAAKGLSDCHQWFGPPGSRVALEIQVPGRRFCPAFAVWDGLRLKCSSALDPDPTEKGTARVVGSSVVRSSHLLKGGRAWGTTAGHVASSKDFGMQKQQGRVVGKVRGMPPRLSNSERSEWSHCKIHVDRVLALLSNADSWKPELEQQLGELHLQLHVDKYIVQRVLVESKRNTNVAYEFLQWAKTQGYKPNFHDYSPVISGLIRAGRFDKTQTVLEGMLQDGYRMQTIIFRILIHGFSSAGRVNDVLEALNQMQVFNCEPDREIYCGVFKAIGRTDIDLPALIQREIGRWGHSTAQLSLFFWALSRRGKVDEVWSLYQQASQNGWALDAPTYARIIVLLGRAGRRDEAQDLFKEMTEKGLNLAVSGVYLSIQSLDALGRTEEANKYIQQWKKSAPDGTSLVYIIFTLARWGMVEDALDLYSERRAEGFRLKYLRSFDTMLEIVSRAVMSGICRMSLLEELWQDMSGRVVPNISTYGLVINIVGKGPQGDEMIWKLFQEIRSKGLQIESPITYDTLIHRFCESGKAGFAFELWRETCHQKLQCPSTLLATLVRSLVQEDKTPEAREVAESVDIKCSELSDNRSLYEELVETLCKVGKLEDAETVTKEVSVSNDSALHGKMYAAMIRGLNTAGNQEAAVQLLQKVQEKEGFQDVSVYNEVLRALGSTGRVDEVVTLFQGMKEKGLTPDVETYTALIEFLGKSDRVDEASKLFAEMKHNGCVPSDRTYQVIGSMPRPAFQRLMM